MSERDIDTPDPERPVFDLGAIVEGCDQLHQLMLAYVAAGFTRKEALELVKTVLVRVSNG